MPHLVDSTPKQIIQMKMEANKEKKAKRKKQNINGKDYVVLNCKVKPYLDKTAMLFLVHGFLKSGIHSVINQRNFNGLRLQKLVQF